MTGNSWLDLILALLPAIVAIGTALWSKRVIPSLALGAFVGAMVAEQGSAVDGVAHFMRLVVDAVFPGASELEVHFDQSGNWAWGLLGVPDPSAGFPLDTSHVVVTGFSILVAATVAVMGRTGATRSVVQVIERAAKGPRGAMVASWLSGAVIFFDDYANCLVVGSAMGPVCDRFRVSRAKLAYIVDSTAAPIASLALVSTWVGSEVSWIHDELVRAGSDANAFSVFLSALPYRFYGFFTIAFVGAIALSGRDFGPMWAIERDARLGRLKPLDLGQALKRAGNPLVAIMPVCTLVVGTFGWMYWTGRNAVLAEATAKAQGNGLLGADVSAAATQALSDTPLYVLIGSSDPFFSMLYASLAAFLLACILALVTRTAGVTELFPFAWGGTKPVMGALGILFMAWTLGNAMEATNANTHLKGLLVSDATISMEHGGPVTGRWEKALPSDIPLKLVAVSSGGDAFGSRPLTEREAAEKQVVVEPGEFGSLPKGVYHLEIRDTTSLHAANIEVRLKSPPWFPPWLLPSIVFLLAACTAFATGTSFGTMGILLPLVIPLSLWLEPSGIGAITLSSISAVLAGACLGDHASPISDTTILSSIGAGADLMTHVKTQLPYALSAGTIALVAGYIPAGLGISPWFLLPIGITLSILTVMILGRKTDLEPETNQEQSLEA